MVNPALFDYISKAKSAQLNSGQIIQNLRQAGWPEQDIQQAVGQTLSSTVTPVTQISQPSSRFAQMFSSEKIINEFPEFLIRFGLAFVFLYASFFVSNVEVGTKYVPQFLVPIITQIMPLETFLFLHASGEVLLAIWLLSGIQTKYAALLTALLISAVTLLNLEYFVALFRNIAIISSALGLFALKVQQKK